MEEVNTKEKNEVQELNKSIENTQLQVDSKNETNENEKTNNIETPSNSANEVVEDVNTKDEQSKKKFPKLKLLSTISGLLLWLLVFILLALLIMTVVSRKTDVLGYRLYIIMSGSMEPTIHVKDAIVTKEIDAAQEGDIIAFENGNIVTVHRVIQVYTEGNNRLYQTKGDFNNTKDKGLVQQSQVKGKVVCRLPFLGKAMIFLQTHLIAVMVVVGILILIILVRRII